MSPSPTTNPTRRLFAAVAMLIFGVMLTSTFIQTCLSSRQLSSNFFSPETWVAITVGGKSGDITQAAMHPPDEAAIRFQSVFLRCAIVAFVTWIGGAAWLVWRCRMSWIDAAMEWGWYGWIWWCLLDGWEWLWIAAGAIGLSGLANLLAFSPQFWMAGCLAGWLTTWMSLGRSSRLKTSESPPLRTQWLWFACGLYIVVFTTMNWRLYFNLLIPHGDSVMYEEHLWNVLHGKGFRSYLDQGLFLGEHIQFVHLFLLPLYVIWPSHLLLEACSTTALACGMFPVYWMVRRHTGCSRTAFAASVAYLLYFPMQFLDIEIDLKSFRPESFGIPLLLLTLDQLDRRNLIGTLIGILFCLTVKEDYCLIFGPLGVWIAFSEFLGAGRRDLIPNASHWLSVRNSWLAVGMTLSLFSVFYLWLATRVIMPWFRSGVEVHYASYFAKFGKSPEEILRTMISQPTMVLESFFTIETGLYALALLAPLAAVPLLSPGRLAVGLPLFGILCLNELEGSRTPQHQFHAPLVAIIFWALAAAIPRASSFVQTILKRILPQTMTPIELTNRLVGNLVWTSALATGIFVSLSPLGSPFWDPGSSWNWSKLYAPTKRAEMFEKIATLIPTTAHVASTDFVHPRYTHFERSYDYSNYQRKVSGEGRRIPPDTDYIVIDTNHRYSTIKQPGQIPELRDEPDVWELLPDQTEGYFFVLKRKDKPSTNSQTTERTRTEAQDGTRTP